MTPLYPIQLHKDRQFALGRVICRPMTTLSSDWFIGPEQGQRRGEKVTLADASTPNQINNLPSCSGRHALEGLDSRATERLQLDPAYPEPVQWEEEWRRNWFVERDTCR